MTFRATTIDQLRNIHKMYPEHRNVNRTSLHRKKEEIENPIVTTH